MLLPDALRRHELLWVLPVGACAVALALTVLGFAHVPFNVVAGHRAAPSARVVAAALAYRAAARRSGRLPAARAGRRTSALLLARGRAHPAVPRRLRRPSRGRAQDAHLAVGTAQFLQKHPPTAVAVEEPVDRVPLVWRSKQPIYYALAAVATLSGPRGVRDDLGARGGDARARVRSGSS